MDGSLENDINKDKKIEINKIDPTPFTNNGSPQNISPTNQKKS